MQKTSFQQVTQKWSFVIWWQGHCNIFWCSIVNKAAKTEKKLLKKCQAWNFEEQNCFKTRKIHLNNPEGPLNKRILLFETPPIFKIFSCWYHCQHLKFSPFILWNMLTLVDIFSKSWHLDALLDVSTVGAIYNLMQKG